MERLATPIWNHERASGRFTARAARFDFEDVEAALAPSGRVFGTASLDFAHAGSVPYRASFRLEQADVPGVADVVGLPRDFATGRIDLAGSFEGSLAPRVPASAGLTGLLSLRARDGEIRRVLPAVVAIALASRSFNPFTGREQIRYDRAETVIEFADGRMHTEALSIDGPDLRIFASGDLSLASPAHDVDAHVVLFLFRQIDNVIGRIPVLNLLLGPNENLLAAYFNLDRSLGRAGSDPGAAALARERAGEPGGGGRALLGAQGPAGDRSDRRRRGGRARAGLLARAPSPEGLVVD